MNRRNFFKYGLAAVATLALSPLRSFAADAAPAKTPLSEKDPTAQGLGYKNDNTKVDTKKFPKKAGADGKSQKCSTCQFYTAIDAKHGSCQIFWKNTVNSNGWCNSYVKKAG